MKLKEKIKNLSTKSLLLILGIVIGAGISVVYASVSWKGTSKISKAISENRVAKPSELQEIKDNLNLLHSAKMECVNAMYRDKKSGGSESKMIWKSNLSHTYTFDSIIKHYVSDEGAASNVLHVGCKSPWTLTSCSGQWTGDTYAPFLMDKEVCANSLGADYPYTMRIRCCRIVFE